MGDETIKLVYCWYWICLSVQYVGLVLNSESAQTTGFKTTTGAIGRKKQLSTIVDFWQNCVTVLMTHFCLESQDTDGVKLPTLLHWNFPFEKIYIQINLLTERHIKTWPWSLYHLCIEESTFFFGLLLASAYLLLKSVICLYLCWLSWTHTSVPQTVHPHQPLASAQESLIKGRWWTNTLKVTPRCVFLVMLTPPPPNEANSQRSSETFHVTRNTMRPLYTERERER